MQKIFVVEDDDNIRDMVMYALRTANFQTIGFSDGGEVIPALLEEPPALILLDIMLPTVDGISLLREIRGKSVLENVPVIMLTAKGSEMDRIKGLDFGADDYITKPFSVMEVISRVKAVLRRSSAPPTNNHKGKFAIGSIVLDSSHHVVTVDNEEVSLTYKEFELLTYMMTNANIALSRDTLLDHVWGYEYSGESRTVDMHIKSLRKKLGDSGNQIKTIRNIGYKIGENS